MRSSAASARSLIAFALNCFAVSLFCLFSFAYSADTKSLIFAHVLVTAGLASHSLTAASYSPVLLRYQSAMSVLSFRSDVIPALVSCCIAFSTLLK